VLVQKRGISVEIKACEKCYHRRPERSALGVHIDDIPISWKINRMKKTMPFLEFAIRDIKKWYIFNMITLI
jgi:hypothetical protein